MPYVKQKYRKILDPRIQELAALIQEQAKEDLDLGGLLNYTCTCLGLLIIPARRYHWMAFIHGVWGTMIAEFYRKYVAPYEDEKERENGPVYPLY